VPTSEAILEGLTRIANEWRILAVAWHLVFAALIAALLSGWRPSERRLGALLAVPFASVSALAWISANPFNGTMFAVLSLMLAWLARLLPPSPIRLSTPLRAGLGAVLVAFGWTYPHFLAADGWLPYAYAAPLGLIPCPTLAAVTGLTLLVMPPAPNAWASLLGGAGCVYGLIGAARLGVPIDTVLLAGGILLLWADRRHREPATATS
jgi:hypothetical protein